MTTFLGTDGSTFKPEQEATCDFCLERGGVRWAYPVTDFAVLPGEDDSGWATCEVCSVLIEGGEFEALVQRVAERVGRQRGVDAKHLAPHLREVYRRFWNARGERIPSDGTMHDPTREPMPDLEADWEEMMGMTSNSVTFAIDGPRLDDDKTFSAEAFRQVESKLGLWLGSRVMRRWKQTKVPPHRMEVSLAVKFDGLDSSHAVRIILEDTRHSNGGDHDV